MPRCASWRGGTSVGRGGRPGAPIGAGGVVSGLFYLLVIWPAAKATMSQLVILTLGLSVLLRGVVTAFWGTEPLRVPPLTGEAPVVWAGKILGFGEYEYRDASGHSGRAPLLAFAPGPTKHTLYLVPAFAERWPELVAQLGPHKASKGCLYLTRLEGVDRGALRALLQRSLDAN